MELKFLRELILIRQANQKSVISVTTDIFLDKGFTFQLDVCNGCHDVSMMSMNLSDIAILNIKVAAYGCIIGGISKREAIKLMQNTNLSEKSGTL